ncbi:hypothetical protein NBRC3299_2782 [Acetobacter pasteurianus NBRC 3299]|nr:hypothetical protein NBRC3299_2782 [Acetobacter pasteurianus NBRC 3299]
MVNEAVWQGKGAETHVVQKACAGQMVPDKGAKATFRTFLNGNQHCMVAGQIFHQFRIKRLGKAGIRHGGRQATGGQHVCGFQALSQTRAKRENGHATFFRPGLPTHFTDDTALANFQRCALGRQVQPKAAATRVAQGKRAFIKQGGGCCHVQQFHLIRWGHNGHARQAAQIGNVKRASMSGAIGSHQTSAVNGKAHGQLLQHHIVHHLIIGALEEGGINGAERAQPFRSHTCGKGDGMLLGNAHIKKPVRICFGEGIQPRARRHGGGDGGNLVVGGGTARELAGEHGSVARRPCRAFFLLTGDNVELGNGVILVPGFFGWLIAVAFFRDDMQHDGAVIRIAQVAQDRDQLRQIMPIYGANVVKAQFFKQRAAGNHAAGIFIGLAGCAFHRGRQLFDKLASQFTQAHELA